MVGIKKVDDIGKYSVSKAQLLDEIRFELSWVIFHAVKRSMLVLSPLSPLLLQHLSQSWCLTSKSRSVIAAKRFLSSYWRRHSCLYLKALPEVDQVGGGRERHGSLGAGVLEQRREQLPERWQVGGLLLDMQESTGYRTQAFTGLPRDRVDQFDLFDY